MTRRFLCKLCRHVFDMDIISDSSIPVEVRCPGCGSTDIMEAPTWAPLDSGQNIFENDFWEYQCQQCKKNFKLPIPNSPAEDKSRRCLFCNSEHLHLLTGSGYVPLYCG